MSMVSPRGYDTMAIILEYIPMPTPDSTYSHIASILQTLLPSAESSDLSLQNKLTYHIQHRCADADYDQYATEYFKEYWPRNYWKSVYFFEYEYLAPSALKHSAHANEPFNVTVLGAGSAADTIALLTWINTHTPFANVSITLVDRSKKQLELAKRCIDTALPHLTETTCSVTYIHADLKDWIPNIPKAHLVMAIYLFTSNQDLLYYVTHLIYLLLRNDGDAIIIESTRDTTWKQVTTKLSNLGLSVYSVGVKEECLKQFSSQFPDAHKTSSPQYLRIKAPERKYYAGLIANYFTAWRHQSVNTVRDIFTNDAVLDEKPGIEQPLHGKQAITQYWVDHPLQQKNIAIDVHQVAYGPNLTMCMFGGNFETPKQHIDIQGAFYFYIDSHTQKIERLVEQFTTKKTPHR